MTFIGGRGFNWKRGVSLCLVALVGACGFSDANAPRPTTATAQFTRPATSDLEQMWLGATVALPVRGSTGSMITTNDGGHGLFTLTGAAPKTQWPVVLVIGGCGRPAPTDLMKALAEQGYIVLAPDSQRQTFAQQSCSDDQTGAGVSEATLRARQTEISFSRDKLRGLPWSDEDNFFLLGIDDGAAAVARYGADGFKARILAEWGCQGTDGVRGIANEARSPVFVATSAVVPTYAGDCSPYLSAEGGSQILVLPSKYSTSILLEPGVYTQLLRFFDRQLFK